ncbi:exodeoxyribonuclease III [Massilia sp. YMA4]|uniref:exodeoxyribonuclease III n=1 Tax=Massilia sp. YMA4 TaxID=1593482 RepID=UPI000DD151E4|nr:exodeoxyribonuclease III [Massilia sp. YMA4]AXA90331.1 exodeoxyribonuclease III [Massilia sp. YMA4]
MRIATFNVNGIGSRLPALLQWLEEKQPDVACLQELKAPQEKFPLEAIRAAGYEAIWHGQKSWNGVAILAKGTMPQEIGRGLPGDPEDEQSRYIEAVVHDVVIACLYLPNGNPAPGPKFDYKLKWFERLIRRGEQLLATGAKVVMAGDFNVMPTELDVYKPERWVDDALFRPETREAFHRLVAQGWTDALRIMHPGEKIYTFWDYFRNAYGRDAGLRIDHLLLSPALAPALKAAGVDRDVRGREKPSDHAPTWIELDLAAAGQGKAAAAPAAAPAKATAARKTAAKPAVDAPPAAPSRRKTKSEPAA